MNRAPRYAVTVAIGIALTGATLLAGPAGTKTPSFVGTLQKVDGQTLVVQTKTGFESVVVGANTEIRHGSKPLALADLPFEEGARVKVRYREANGHKEAQSVMVSTVRGVVRDSGAVGTTATSQTSSKKP